MQDTLKSFLIALVTSVAVLFILGPVMMKVQMPPETASVSQSAVVPPPAPTPAKAAVPSDAPAPTPKMTAPNLGGTAVTEARERWRSQGILIIESGEREDATAKAGTIVEQSPVAGAPLERKEIQVTVASSPELAVVPNAVGKKVDKAREELVAAGFEVPPESKEKSEKAPGEVIRQEPNPGARSKTGSLVRLIVSDGPDTIEIPRVIGKRVGAARKILQEAGLQVGRVSEREDPEMSGGKVLSQKPKAGSQAKAETQIDLVIVAPD